MLIDSEQGYLFDTSEKGVEELDLLKASKKNEVMFLTLNGLVYKHFMNNEYINEYFKTFALLSVVYYFDIKGVISMLITKSRLQGSSVVISTTI